MGEEKGVWKLKGSRVGEPSEEVEVQAGGGGGKESRVSDQAETRPSAAKLRRAASLPCCLGPCHIEVPGFRSSTRK